MKTPNNALNLTVRPVTGLANSASAARFGPQVIRGVSQTTLPRVRMKIALRVIVLVTIPLSGCISPYRGAMPLVRPELSCGSAMTGTASAGALDFESKDYDWSDYYSELYWVVWRSWHRALLDKVNSGRTPHVPKGTKPMSVSSCCKIRFTILRHGQVSELQVLEETGDTTWTLAAVSALKEKSLPSLPRDFSREQELVTSLFVIQIDDFLSWVTHLKQMQHRGIL